MAVLPVLHEPDKRLRIISKPVEAVTPEIVSFLQDLVDTMHQQQGIGLAAPQVNVHKRIIVLQAPTSLDDDRDNLPLYKMINPVIVQRSDEKCSIEEYCLSVPGEGVEIERSYRITVEYLDEQGIRQSLAAENILSICLQHEIDHLNGRLIIDSLSPLKKKVALKRLIKRKQDEE
jgi:peptide deformylase